MHALKEVQDSLPSDDLRPRKLRVPYCHYSIPEQCSYLYLRSEPPYSRLWQHPHRCNSAPAYRIWCSFLELPGLAWIQFGPQGQPYELARIVITSPRLNCPPFQRENCCTTVSPQESAMRHISSVVISLRQPFC